MTRETMKKAGIYAVKTENGAEVTQKIPATVTTRGLNTEESLENNNKCRWVK